MSNQGNEVLLLQYDLTNGLATTVFKFMTGKDIEAVWHTSLVVYNTEYFFGGGICRGIPRCTPYGKPKKESVFGYTDKSKSDFEAFLKTIDTQFNASTYDVLKHNCNHFTNAICNFLCNKPLPDEILNQHEYLAQTEFGKWLVPTFERVTKNLQKTLPQYIENQAKMNNNK